MISPPPCGTSIHQGGCANVQSASGCGSRSSAGEGKVQTRTFGRSYLHTILRAILKVHTPQNYTPSLRARVALAEILIIIPHQFAVRFRYNRLLRVRVHRRSAVEAESWERRRCRKVWFVRDEKLSQE